MAVSSARHFGSGLNLGNSNTSDVNAAFGWERRVQTVGFSTAGNEVILPDIDGPEIPIGRNLFIFWNSGSESFDLVDQNGLGLSETITTAQAVKVGTYRNPTTGVRGWAVIVRAQGV